MKKLEKMKRIKISKLLLLRKIVLIAMVLVCVPGCICALNHVFCFSAFIVLFLLSMGLLFIECMLIVEIQKRDEEAKRKAQLEKMRKTMEEIDSWDA